MSLFKFSTADVAYFAKGIYIPICFYFNYSKGKAEIQIHEFTFQYVSILMKEAINITGQYLNLHSNMFLF